MPRWTHVHLPQWFVIAILCGSLATPLALAQSRSDNCVPACDGRACGDDGCGGSCGTCPGDNDCRNGVCVPNGCGADPAGGKGCDECSCETCVCEIDDWCCKVEWDDICGQLCSEQCDGDCPCEPDCTGLSCGDDGCGGSCGSCAPDTICSPFLGACCTQSCDDRQCGPDGCGDPDGCGSCNPGTRCDEGTCVPCVHDCEGKACGDDSCGGSCGTCEESAVCRDGTCHATAYPDLCFGQGRPSADTCPPQLTAAGCCDGFGRVVWCDNDNLFCVDCPGNRSPRYQSCGWTDTTLLTGYDCGFEGEDPSGGHPSVCDFCLPACIAKECGEDGCGGFCGHCTDGRTCKGGLCVVPMEDVHEPDARDDDAGGTDAGTSDALHKDAAMPDSPPNSDTRPNANDGVQADAPPNQSDPGDARMDTSAEFPEDFGRRVKGSCTTNTTGGTPSIFLVFLLPVLGWALQRRRRHLHWK